MKFTVVSVVCGSLGWNHPSLLQSFYPEDLPEDWRLTYYANEFAVVLLPQPCWIDVSIEQLQEWRGDVGESFRFFFFFDEPCEDSQIALLRRGLDYCYGGIVKKPQNVGAGIHVLPVQDSANRNITVVLLSDDAALNLKAMRAKIDDLVSDFKTSETVYLFIESEHSLYKSLNSVQMLLELSGY